MPSSRIAVFCCGSLLAIALLASQPQAADSATALNTTVRDGVAVAFSLLPVNPATGAVGTATAREAARVRFTITDTTSGKPLTRLHPAAWLSRRGIENQTQTGDFRPHSLTEKVQELLGGSIFSKADADFNSFQVLTLNDDASINVVDPLFGFGGTKLLALIPLPGIGTDWVFNASSTLLYVTTAATDKLAVIDTASWTVSTTLTPCAKPSRLVLQPDAHYVWVDCAAADDAQAGVAVMAADRPEVVTRIVTGNGQHHIAFSADSRWAFVANEQNQTLSVIDVHSLKKVRDLKLADRPTGIVYSALSDSVYVWSQTRDSITVVDASTQKVVAHVPAVAGMAQIRFAPGDRYGLITAPNQNLLLILDAVSNRIIQRASIDQAPEQVAFSSDMVFVRRRGSASVGMIPLKEIGREGLPLPLAEFVGGEHAFGPRSNLADSIVPAPGETAVVVTNPKDKSLYYYMEGMAAPMGTFDNYGREPRAVLVLDRSLREVLPGVYETTAALPAAGVYDTIFFLSTPRIIHAFGTNIVESPVPNKVLTGPTTTLVALPNQTIVPGQIARLTFRFGSSSSPSPSSPNAALPVVPPDLTLRAVLAPGTWHQRHNMTLLPDGSVTFEFTPPSPGLYYFYAESAALGKALNSAPCLVLQSVEKNLEKPPL
ncbi:YncE family protein [Undibacterium sp. Di26W]|uniref:YncE family protein n=1 Tax=Undibacterium sp. Di26W TaxID=3413035 RepID=UPI003BF2B654